MPRTVIEWDRQQAIVAVGDVTGVAATFQSVSCLKWSADGPNADTATAALRRLFPTGPSRTPAPVILVFPRQSVTIHRIQLPQAPDGEIPDMVRLQASLRLTVPVDMVCLDFAPLPSPPGSATRDVLLVTVPLDQVNAVRNVLNACQLELSEIRVSSFTITAAAAAAGLLDNRPDDQTVDALVLVRPDFIEVIFVRGHSVVYSHSGISWSPSDGVEKAVRSELNRARMAAAETLNDSRIGRLILIGSPEVTSAVSDQVGSRLNDAKIVRIDPRATMISGTLNDDVSAASLVAVAGVLSAERTALVQQVDLQNPRRAPEVRDYRRTKVLATVLAATALFAAVYSWRQSRVQSLQSRASELTQSIDEIRGNLEIGQIDLETSEAVESWVQRDINWLDELVRLKKLLPSTDRMIVKSVSCAVIDRDPVLGTVQIEGRAKTADDVEALARRLVDAGFEVDPYKPESSQIDPAYPTTIKLQLTIPL